MTRREGKAVHAVTDALRRGSSPRPPDNSRWPMLVLILVVLGHAGLGLYLTTWRNEMPPDDVPADGAMQVQFVDRAAVPKQATPRQPVRSKLVPANESRFRPGIDLPTTPVHIDLEAPAVPAQLRLHLLPDPWNSRSFADGKRSLDRTAFSIPGRAEPFMEGIRPHQASPKEKLEAFAREHMGIVKYDACGEARRRLANVPSALDALHLAADLEAVERRCRP